MNTPLRQHDFGKAQRYFAFTLIELLVVISIIALLISLLLPALREARMTAQQAACLNLEKQYAVANEIYANEYQEWYVPIIDGIDFTVPDHFPLHWVNNAAFLEKLQVDRSKYINLNYCGPKSITCPSAPLLEQPSNQGAYRLDWSYGFNQQEYYDYAAPAVGAIYPTVGSVAWWSYQGYKRSLVVAPSDRLFFTDSTSLMMDKWSANAYPGVDQPATGGYWVSTSFRHNGSVNVYFADAHVATLPGPMIYSAITASQQNHLWWMTQGP